MSQEWPGFRNMLDMWIKMFLDKHTLILSDVAVKQILDRVNMEGLVKSVDIIYKYSSEELMKPCDLQISASMCTWVHLCAHECILICSYSVHLYVHIISASYVHIIRESLFAHNQCISLHIINMKCINLMWRQGNLPQYLPHSWNHMVCI
jgi:hypothetical protein